MIKKNSSRVISGPDGHEFAKVGLLLHKKIEDKLLVILPDGHPMIMIGMNPLIVRDQNTDIFKKKYFTQERWANDAMTLLQDNGYSGAGS